MNPLTKLLRCLDAVYGFPDQTKSSVHKINQTYDQKYNVHVFTLEYRSKRDDGGVVSRRLKENGILQYLLRQ